MHTCDPEMELGKNGYKQHGAYFCIALLGSTENINKMQPVNKLFCNCTWIVQREREREREREGVEKEEAGGWEREEEYSLTVAFSTLCTH